MNRLIIIVFLLFFLFPECCYAQQQQLLFSVEIPLMPGRQVRVNLPDGESRQIGAVVSIPVKPSWPAFDASKWGRPGTVVASSVNAIHLLLDVEKGRGRSISLLATYTTAPAARGNGTVLIDGVGGTGLWASWAPPVGTPVFIRNEQGQREPLSSTSFLTAKSLEYDVYMREDAPYSVEIENRLDGAVTVVWPNRPVRIGKVVHPVNGIGFFDGTQYQGTGRIRANHPGVICVSTAPHGVRAGFQVIPLAHARSKEMKSAWYEPQWMIIEPLIPLRAAPGTEPLFSSFLVPGPHPKDRSEALWGNLLFIPKVQCRVDEGEWTDFPEVTKNGPDSVLQRVTHLRILFPFPLQQ